MEQDITKPKALTKDGLIANQQLEIELLRKDRRLMRDTLLEIARWPYYCGKPLNDNCKGYTPPQMADFLHLAETAETALNNIQEYEYD